MTANSDSVGILLKTLTDVLEIELLKKIYPKGDNRTKVTYYDENDMAGDITVVQMKEEIKERTGKTALYVSPAGTYVVQEKPDKKTVLLSKRDKEGNVIKDKDGQPIIEEKQVTERLPERLVLYDHADQKIAEQLLDFVIKHSTLHLFPPQFFLLLQSHLL